ncbi:MAG TPA: RNA polymerase sigma factor [Syntrophorhabdaceae bacterium]|jgi:RNA polymerase sigma-70 factor (ECF subfamily)
MAEDALDFGQMYEMYRKRIERYLSRLVGETEAEDLTQETFLKAGKKLEGFRGEAQPLTWLYKIATNTALDRLKSPSFRQLVQIEPAPGPAENASVCAPLPVDASPSPNVERQLIREEMSACIRRVIDRLPENYRTIIVLSNLEGLKDREIADVLGERTGAIKIRLHRAREQLRKELSSTCVFYRDEENELACDLKSLSVGSPGS